LNLLREDLTTAMAQDRLTGSDAALVRREDAGALTHVGTLLLLEGEAPDYPTFLAHVEARLPLVPRARQKLAFAPLGARAVWVDDRHLNLPYHVRHTALPPPAGEPALRALLAQLLAQRLDRSQPLWEAWLVERVGEDRFALLLKAHPALVAPGAPDLASALLDPGPPPVPERAWAPRPAPSRAELLADVLADGAALPGEAVRGLAWALGHPGDAAQRARETAESLARAAPPSPVNLPGGPHRRFAWVEEELAPLEAAVAATGASLHAVAIAAVAGALRLHLLEHGYGIPDRDLVARVPVGTEALLAPLPLGAAEPIARLRLVHAGLGPIALPDPRHARSLLHDAARLQVHEPAANLTVLVVPGPPAGAELLGRALAAAHPALPLPEGTAMGVALALRGGRAHWSLLGDPDALPDPDGLLARLPGAVAELVAAAGVPEDRAA